MSADNRDSFHGQLASIVEALANAAVAEICRLVDEGYEVLRLEISQNQREIDCLRRKLLVAKFQNSRRNQLDRLGSLRRAVPVTRGPRDGAVCLKPHHRAPVPGRDTEAETPVIIKVESGGGTGRKDTQPSNNQECEVITAASAKSSTTPPVSRSLRVEPEKQISNQRNPNANQRFPNLPPPFIPQPSTSAKESDRRNGDDINCQSYCAISNSDDDTFTHTTSSQNDSSLFSDPSSWTDVNTDTVTWNDMGVLPHNPVPGEDAGEPLSDGGLDGTRTKSHDYRIFLGVSERGGEVVSDVMGSVVSSLASDLEWEPSLVVAGSFPIKVEEDVGSEWSIMDRDPTTEEMSVEGGQQKEKRERVLGATKRGVEVKRGREGRERLMESNKKEGVDEVNADCPLRMMQNTGMAERATEPESTLENVKTLLSHSSLSLSSSSISSASIKKSGQLLESLSNHRAQQSSTHFANRNPSVSKLPNYLLTTTLLPQRSGSGGRHQVQCGLCGKGFANFPSLRRHQRVHTGEKPFSCRHCSKCFSHRHQMKNHERVHTGEKPFCCPVCGRRFVQSNHMKRHLSIHAVEQQVNVINHLAE